MMGPHAFPHHVNDGKLLFSGATKKKFHWCPSTVYHWNIYFSGARDCLQHNHNHEFSVTLLNQLFQERQPSNIQCNTIPPLTIIFAINWSVGYWWWQSGYWKKSTFQLFPSIIKKVLISADLSPTTSSPSNFQRNTIPPLAIIFAINWSVGYWWRRSGYWKTSTFQLFPSIIKKALSFGRGARSTTLGGIFNSKVLF
jgi:hypothetical protein